MYYLLFMISKNELNKPIFSILGTSKADESLDASVIVDNDEGTSSR